MTRRISAILGKDSGAGQGCTRHFSVPPLEYKNSTSYKKSTQLWIKHPGILRQEAYKPFLAVHESFYFFQDWFW